MSRSKRKKPIMGITTCKSEAKCKAQWHKRWRRGEKVKLKLLHNVVLDDHYTVHHREVSNVWDMGKDGKKYFSPKKQVEVAKIFCMKPFKGRSNSERIIHQWMGK